MSKQLIKAIRVQKLFGLYSYEINQEGGLSNVAILYGDNGLGKSTILRLVFHLLSPSNNRGHRTALAKTAFEKLEVDLASGITLRASRIGVQNPDVLELTVRNGKKVEAVWNYLPKGKRSKEASEEAWWEDLALDGGRKLLVKGVFGDGRVRKMKLSDGSTVNVPSGERAYMEALSKAVPVTFILNADRRLDSDSVPDPSDEVELRKLMHYQEPSRINDLVVRSREIALSQALGKAAQWLSRKAVKGANKGSTNVHSTYGTVLKQLVAPQSRTKREQPNIDINELLNRVAVIEEKTAELSQYELETPLSMGDFRKALEAKAVAKRNLAANLLEPYIRSLEGRVDALSPIYRVIDQFINIVNGLLQDKAIQFDLSHGFSIVNKLGAPLAVSELSSGEQQLLLLFCCVLTARDESSIFMIDEPEISLNIKWQRKLIQSLLSITEGASIQFILASHSVELFAQHRSRVIKLENLIG